LQSKGRVISYEPLPEPEKLAGYYRDIAVLAFPTPPDDSYRIQDIPLKATFETKSVPYDTEFGLPPLPISFPSLPAESRIDQNQIRRPDSQLQSRSLGLGCACGQVDRAARRSHFHRSGQSSDAKGRDAGLECDKLSKVAIELHFKNFLQEIISDLGSLAGKTLVSTHIDSWEFGAQNWTTQFRAEFQQRCGYDIIPFLPVMTGRAVGDLGISERFLWDLRKTISDLVIENYAERLRELATNTGCACPLRLTMAISAMR